MKPATSVLPPFHDMGFIVPVLPRSVSVDLIVHPGPARHRSRHVRQLGRVGGELSLQRRAQEGRGVEGKGRGVGFDSKGVRVWGVGDGGRGRGGYFEDKGGAPAGARGCCFKKKKWKKMNEI